jgi:uncharacterized membrane protein HdeD (DUF308 family)
MSERSASDVADHTDAAYLRDPAALIVAWRRQISDHWKLFLTIGALMVATGIFAIFVPVIFSISVAILVGWALVIGGVFQLGHVFRRGAGLERVASLLLGLITVIAGLALLLFPLDGTITLTIVLIAWFFVSGGMQLAAWWEARHAGRSWVLLLNALASVVLGILIWVDFPSSASWAIGLLVGIEFLLWGNALIMAAIAGRALAQRSG